MECIFILNNGKLSILHVSTEVGWRGGEQQVKLVTDGLAQRGHTIKVLSPPGAALLLDRQQAGIGEPLPIRWGEWDFAASRVITRTARAMNADLIHAQTSHAHTLALRAARKLDIPLVVSRRVDFRVAGNWFSRRKYLHSAVRYVAISHAIKDVLITSGIPPSFITVVHSGVETDRFPMRGQTRDEELARKWGAGPGAPLLVNAAALTDHKDQSTLLRAAAIMKKSGVKYRLVIAGSGELEIQLKTLQKELGLMDDVLFAGYVSDLSTLYPAADIFVMSSHLEGLCTSILDAMSAGIPVVATQAGGIPEIVKHGENGLLAPVKNPEALAELLTQMIQNESLRNQFRSAGRNTVLSKFTNDKMVTGIENTYRQILDEETIGEPDIVNAAQE